MDVPSHTWTTGELARLAGVSVRTLHHYDAIGLLRPRTATEGGYRLYGRPELERLHLVLLYRGAGLPLAAIGKLLDDSGFDRTSALREHRARLVREREALDGLLANLDRMIEGDAMSAHDLFEDMPKEWAEEAENRWGGTDSFKESARRTKRYTPEDWAKIKAEMQAIEEDFATLLSDGAPADGGLARAVAERARQHIDRWYYPCSRAMHVQLAEGYVSDPRFEAHYEERAVGLARYVHDAIVANSGA